MLKPTKKSSLHEDDDKEPIIIPDIEESVNLTGRLLNQHHFYGRLIHAEVDPQAEDLM